MKRFLLRPLRRDPARWAVQPAPRPPRRPRPSVPSPSGSSRDRRVAPGPAPWAAAYTLTVLRALTFSLLLLAAPWSLAAESAVTLYSLNCMGCHLPPAGAQEVAEPLRGQFAQSVTGRIFFINVPPPNSPPLTAQEDARLLREILDWKRSCSVILQDAPLVRYLGERHVK